MCLRSRRLVLPAFVKSNFLMDFLARESMPRDRVSADGEENVLEI